MKRYPPYQAQTWLGRDSVLCSDRLDHPGSGEHRFLPAEETGATDTECCDCYARRQYSGSK